MASLAEHLKKTGFGLTLSSGFFGFYAHAGLLRALEEAELRPTRLSGSSAGALVAGLWAAGVGATAIAEELLRLERSHFWDPAPGFGLLRGELFRQRLASLMSPQRIEDCPVPLAISAFDLGRRKTVVLDRGELPSAICASCAFPGLLQPVRREGRWLSDGGIADRHGLAGMPDSAGPLLYHHLASRSPWRRRSSPGLKVPARRHMVALRIFGLPRVHPFRLSAGAQAMTAAYVATRRALAGPARPVVDLDAA